MNKIVLIIHSTSFYIIFFAVFAKAYNFVSKKIKKMKNELKEFADALKTLSARLEEFANIEKEATTVSPCPTYLTLKQACEYLGVTRASLYTMMCRKKIPYYKPAGKNTYFLQSDLDEWIGHGRIKSASEIEAEAAKLCVR